ncbi:hypothetical protein ESCNG_130058 [Neisseria gonorrhoeae]|nr:hypothetical protein ESCNG_130058 [Neisseria gonorrhoeae]
MMAGKRPRKQGGANAADVQVTGGAGGETGFDGHNGSEIFESVYFTVFTVLRHQKCRPNPACG